MLIKMYPLQVLPVIYDRNLQFVGGATFWCTLYTHYAYGLIVISADTFSILVLNIFYGIDAISFVFKQ